VLPIFSFASMYFSYLPVWAESSDCRCSQYLGRGRTMLGEERVGPFQWDDANIRHIARHGIRPSEAEQVILNDPFDLSFETIDDEERVAQLGETDAGWILVVVTTWRRELIRVVTAYPATLRLKNLYATQRGLYSAQRAQDDEIFE
jgi:uncharacterized DUF497 family protein